MKKDTRLLVALVLDRRVPWYARLPALAGAAYIASPFDVIPDLVPGFGWLDDLLIMMAALWLSLRCIPSAVSAGYRPTSVDSSRRIVRDHPEGPRSARATQALWALVIVGILMVLAALAVAYIQSLD